MMYKLFNRTNTRQKGYHLIFKVLPFLKIDKISDDIVVSDLVMCLVSYLSYL